MQPPDALTSWSSRQSTNDRFGYSTWSGCYLKEPATWSGPARAHNSYSSGYSPSCRQWREPATPGAFAEAP